MPVQVTCTKCSKTLNLKDEFAGKKIRCPGCKVILQVPGGAAKTAKPNAKTAPQTVAAPGKTPPSSSRSTAVRPTRVGIKPRVSEPSRQDATVTMKSQVICPSCGAGIPQGEQSCPECKYHLKLRRKIFLSQAIEKASMHSQGLNVDGSKKVTRSDEAEERAEQGRKVGISVKIAFFSFVTVFIFCFIWFVATRLDDYTVAQLREMSPPPELLGENPESFNPLWISLDNETVSITLDADSVYAQTPEFPADWPVGKPAALADFVQALKPPLAITPARFIAESAIPVVTRANELGGRFSPAAIMQKPPATPIYVWRLAKDLTSVGSLRGAILDFGGDEYKLNNLKSVAEEYKRKMAIRQQQVSRAIAREKAFGGKVDEAAIEAKVPLPPMQKLRLRGKLSFIPFYDWDMEGMVGSYRFSAENASANVRRPDSVTKREPKDRPRDNTAYFAPVLIVDEIKVLPVDNKK